MSDIIVFGVSALSKVSEIKDDTTVHLILNSNENLTGDSLLSLSGKNIDLIVLNMDDPFLAGIAGGKLISKFEGAEIIYPDVIDSTSKTFQNASEAPSKPKRHRRTKAEIERDRKREERKKAREKKKQEIKEQEAPPVSIVSHDEVQKDNITPSDF